MPSSPPERGPVLRLHPLSLVFAIGLQAKSFLLPGLVVLIFAARGGRGELGFMLLFVPAVVAALFHYFSYRYRFDRDELVVREGIVFRNERHIPYARIQNIDLVQNPLHRLFHVAEVRLETAVGSRPEAVMRVLSLEAVDAMRERVFTGERWGQGSAEAPAAAAGPPLRTLVELAPRDVLLFGLISNKGLVVVAALFGAAWQGDVFERWLSGLSRESVDLWREALPVRGPLAAGLWAVGALLVLLVALRTLSVAWAFAKFHGFRLTRRGDDLRAEYGLLPHVSKTIPRHRIQVLSTHEGFLHRRSGRVAVAVETAGGAHDAGDAAADHLWLAPLIRRECVPELLGETLPYLAADAADWQPVSPRARRRLERLALWAGLFAGAGSVWRFGAWGLLAALAVAAVGLLHARLWCRHAAWALTPSAVLCRRGWWERELSVAPFAKIQALERRQTPFDRRHGMASVRVDTAGSPRRGRGVEIRFLDLEVADTLLARLDREAERSTFRW